MHVKTGISAAATAVLLLSSTSAFAVDAQAFSERLKAVTAEQEIPLSFASAEAEGEDVILKDVSFGEYGDVGDLTFENVSGSTPEGWTVERLALPEIDKTEDGNRAQVSGVSFEGIMLAGTDEANTPAAMKFSKLFFDKATVASIDLGKDGTSVFTLTDASMENEITDGGAFSTDFNVDGFTADLTAGDSPETTQAIRDVGYDSISGSMTGSANWEPDSGLLELDPFEISVDDAGDLSFTYAISGYTPAFMESLQQLQAQMESNPDNQQATGMAVMGLISQLSLNSADITFTDDSLTGKLLDYYADKNGQSRAELVQNLTAMLPPVLGYLQNPEFQQEVTDAVTAFLDDPQALSISIAPDNPVAATQIMGAAMGAPQTLPKVLSLSVGANDANAE
ncbi:hypothetical protein VQ042_10875 [Aurantimonas sp. A2-1-M11]|uniref:hypothetical protein n=1 Tax=Aurantimonas sp. A2-1-M11 TaxID=3113712 RepID=UPI002F9488E1